MSFTDYHKKYEFIRRSNGIMISLRSYSQSVQIIGVGDRDASSSRLQFPVSKTASKTLNPYPLDIIV